MARIILVLLLLMAGPMMAADDESKAENEKPPVPEAKVSTTQHEMKLGGKAISYTATAGTMLMKNERVSRWH